MQFHSVNFMTDLPGKCQKYSGVVNKQMDLVFYLFLTEAR